MNFMAVDPLLLINLVLMASYYVACSISFIYYLRNPPKAINHNIGYRTRRSQKSQSNWDYAQSVAPAIALKTVAVSYLINVTVMLLLGGRLHFMLVGGIGLIIFVVFLIITIPLTEHKLRKYEEAQQAAL